MKPWADLKNKYWEFDPDSNILDLLLCSMKSQQEDPELLIFIFNQAALQKHSELLTDCCWVDQQEAQVLNLQHHIFRQNPSLV